MYANPKYVANTGVTIEISLRVFVISVPDQGGGCESCYGGRSAEICDSLPSGCMDGRYVWEEKK